MPAIYPDSLKPCESQEHTEQRNQGDSPFLPAVKVLSSNPLDGTTCRAFMRGL